MSSSKRPPAARSSRVPSSPSPVAAAPSPAPPRARSRSDRTALERASADHYVDPLLYDHEYGRRRNDLPFYRRAARLYGRDVLELAVGTGRLALPLARDGVRVTGVDLSQPMLRRCQARVAHLPRAARERVRLVRADFREFAFSRRWPLIICPFNAMMHLYTRDDLARFLACVRDHLEPGGRFCFDVLNPSIEWLARDPTRRWARTRFRHPSTGDPYYYTTNHFYDQATQVAWIRIYYDPILDGTPAPGTRRARREISSPRAREISSPTGTGLDTVERVRRSKVVTLAHRQFFPEELLVLLEINGFSVEKREGGFRGEPFDADSDSQVCTCSIRR